VPLAIALWVLSGVLLMVAGWLWIRAWQGNKDNQTPHSEGKEARYRFEGWHVRNAYKKMATLGHIGDVLAIRENLERGLPALDGLCSYCQRPRNQVAGTCGIPTLKRSDGDNVLNK
jgi:hypothetical protein